MDTSETWWERTARERWERESERSIEKEKPGGAALNTSEELKKKKNPKKKRFLSSLPSLAPPFCKCSLLPSFLPSFRSSPTSLIPPACDLLVHEEPHNMDVKWVQSKGKVCVEACWWCICMRFKHNLSLNPCYAQLPFKEFSAYYNISFLSSTSLLYPVHFPLPWQLILT